MDYGGLKALIASNLRRSDLSSDIASAILDAIQDHGTERFWFNETRSFTISLTSGTDEFSITPTATVQEFVRIDWVRVLIGSAYERMLRIDADTMEEMHASTTTGQPAWWTMYGDQFRVFPTPDATYSARIAGHYRLVPLSADADTNAWTNFAANLIRYSALRRLYAFPIRNAEMSQGAMAMEVQELDYLRRETDRRKRIGVMEAHY